MPILHSAGCFNAEEYKNGGRPSLRITRNAAVPSGQLIGAGCVTRHAMRHRDLVSRSTSRYALRLGGQRIVDKATNRKGQSILVVRGFVI